MAVLFLCPSRALPAVAVWPHPSTLEEESELLITPPSLDYEQTIHILLTCTLTLVSSCTCIYMYKKKLALNNTYPVHQLTVVLSVCEHCGRSVQKFW